MVGVVELALLLDVKVHDNVVLDRLSQLRSNGIFDVVLDPNTNIVTSPFAVGPGASDLPQRAPTDLDVEKAIREVHRVPRYIVTSS